MQETSNNSQSSSQQEQLQIELQTAPQIILQAATEINIKKLSPDAKVPTQEQRDIPDAGWDLYSNMNVRVPGGGKMGIKTGIALAIPKGWYGSIRAKSGIAASTPLLIDAGVIDPGYRGEIIVIVANNSDYPYDVLKGTKIAQILFEPIYLSKFTEVTTLPNSDRGTKGFGSTGQ